MLYMIFEEIQQCLSVCPTSRCPLHSWLKNVFSILACYDKKKSRDSGFMQDRLPLAMEVPAGSAHAKKEPRVKISGSFWTKLLVWMRNDFSIGCHQKKKYPGPVLCFLASSSSWLLLQLQFSPGSPFSGVLAGAEPAGGRFWGPATAIPYWLLPIVRQHFPKWP